MFLGNRFRWVEECGAAEPRTMMEGCGEEEGIWVKDEAALVCCICVVHQPPATDGRLLRKGGSKRSLELGPYARDYSNLGIRA